MKFQALGLPETLCAALETNGITEPTAVQNGAIPLVLLGRDLLSSAKTGSGKTLAFGLAVVSRLAASGNKRTAGRPRALILAPTRELALQIDRTVAPLAKAMKMNTCTVFGGVGQGPQVDAIRRGVDIVIACPGRLEDLIQQRHCQLDRVEVSVLDEADHMADLGFLPGVKRLLDKVPTDAQHLLFSATLDNGIDVLVKKFLTNPVTHEADSASSPVATMEHHVLAVDKDTRMDVLTDLVSAPGDRKSTRLNSSHSQQSRMPSSA